MFQQGDKMIIKPAYLVPGDDVTIVYVLFKYDKNSKQWWYGLANYNGERVNQWMSESQLEEDYWPRSISIGDYEEWEGSDPLDSDSLHTSRANVTREEKSPTLECPFTFLRCSLVFDVSRTEDWFRHSLTHFQKAGRRPTSASPPKSNCCCFCAEKFEATSGILSWEIRMNHVLCHHLNGWSLAQARPDFELTEYLWQEGIIDLVTYRELKPSYRELKPEPQQEYPARQDDTSISGEERGDGTIQLQKLRNPSNQGLVLSTVTTITLELMLRLTSQQNLVQLIQ